MPKAIDANEQRSEDHVLQASAYSEPETGQNVNSLISCLKFAAFYLRREMQRGVSAAKGLIRIIVACPDWCAELAMVEAEQIADYLLVESRGRGENLTNLKLQKLLYYAQAWYLANHDKPLFEEDFKAWVHGPVLTSQYSRFKSNSWRPILDEIEAPELPGKITDHLDEILDVFGTESAISLEAMTHAEEPWREARGNFPPDKASNAIIKKETMKRFYRSL